MNDHAFCRHSLKLTMIEVRAAYTSEQIAAAWAWKVGKQQYEFHGPNGEYNHDVRMADCKWSAMDGGWRKLLEPSEETEVIADVLKI